MLLQIAGNQLCRQYLTLQGAVEDVLGSTESVEKDIVIMQPEQDNSYATEVEENEDDVFHRNDLYPNDIPGI